MKKIIIMFFVSLISSPLLAEPEWYGTPPKEADFYYFTGVGRGASEAAAKNQAQGDVFSQIVYMVNASVNANSSVETYIQENAQEAKREAAIYKKVNAKGDANIENYEEVQKAIEKEKGPDSKTVFIAYVMAKIPKSEIQKARQRAEDEKAKRKDNPIAVFAVAVFPSGAIMEIDTIKSQIEDLYRNMGFSVKSVDIEFTADVFKSTGKVVKFLKEKAGGEVKKVVVCVVTSSGVRKEKLESSIITSLLGDMVIRQIDLNSSEVLSNITLKAKGVSMRKDASAVEDAFKKLIDNLTKEFLESSDEGGKKKDDAI